MMYSSYRLASPVSIPVRPPDPLPGIIPTPDEIEAALYRAARHGSTHGARLYAARLTDRGLPLVDDSLALGGREGER